MCLAIPVRITQLESEETAIASVGGVLRSIDISLLDDVAVDDYVILHVGFALSKLDEKEAERTLQMMSESGALSEVVNEIRG
jgi:hydrogenase expression/formation protein HypC